MSIQIKSPCRQQGAVLIIGLIMMLLLTVIGLASVRGTDLQERMAGNMRDRNLAFQSAEAGLRAGELVSFGLSGTAVPNANGHFDNLNLNSTIKRPAVWEKADWEAGTQSIKLPNMVFTLRTSGRHWFTSAPTGKYDFHAIEKLITNSSISCHYLPSSVCSDLPNIEQSPTQMPDMLKYSSPHGSAPFSVENTIPDFLIIPLEIRLQIYSYVLHSNPVHHAHLSSVETTSTLPPYATEELYQSVKISYSVLSLSEGVVS